MNNDLAKRLREEAKCDLTMPCSFPFQPSVLTSRSAEG